MSTIPTNPAAYATAIKEIIAEYGDSENALYRADNVAVGNVIRWESSFVTFDTVISIDRYGWDSGVDELYLLGEDDVDVEVVKLRFGILSYGYEYLGEAAADYVYIDPDQRLLINEVLSKVE